MLLCLGIALLSTSCAATAGNAQIGSSHEAPALRPLHAAQADFVDRQSIQATYRHRPTRLDAVLQKQGDTLTLVGLTPLGTRAFVLTRRGEKVAFEANGAAALPFPPEYILNDIQRVFFDGIASDGKGLPDGVHEKQRSSERIVEVWRSGRLISRRYISTDEQQPASVFIDFGPGMPPDRTPPARIVLVNAGFDYRLEITTLSHDLL
jgi:hypothetical protein